MNFNRFDIYDMTVVQIFVLQDLLKAMGIEGNPEGTKEECLLAGINTGHRYAVSRQRIFAKIVGHHDEMDRHIVAMIDRDRSVAEYVLVTEFTPEQVMEEYRHSRYFHPPVGGDLPLLVDVLDFLNEFVERPDFAWRYGPAHYDS